MVVLALPGRAFTGRHSLPPRTHPAGHAWGGVSLGVAAAQAKAQYSTTYNYGQEGMAETARFLRMHPAAGEKLVCMKDVGHLAGRRYYSTYSPIQGVPEHTDAILGALASGEARYAVFTQGRGQDDLGAESPPAGWRPAVLPAGEKHREPPH